MLAQSLLNIPPNAASQEVMLEATKHHIQFKFSLSHAIGELEPIEDLTAGKLRKAQKILEILLPHSVAIGAALVRSSFRSMILL